MSVSRGSEAGYRGHRVRLLVRGHGVLGPAHAAALHQHVVLAGQRDRAQRDHQEQVRDVRLRALSAHHVAFRTLAHLQQLQEEFNDVFRKEMWLKDAPRTRPVAASRGTSALS